MGCILLGATGQRVAWLVGMVLSPEIGHARAHTLEERIVPEIGVRQKTVTHFHAPVSKYPTSSSSFPLMIWIPRLQDVYLYMWFSFLHFILVDGFWLNWSNWSDCSKSCGRGFMYRTRVCEDPKYGGSKCVGVSNETMPCNPSSCPGMYPRPSIAIVRFCAHLLLYMYIFINLQIVYPVLILSTYSIISFF